jgi:hypothetical protein
MRTVVSSTYRIDSAAAGRVSGLGARLLVLAGVALLHLLVYFAVTRLTLLRPPSAFIDPRTALDDWIPHLAWTWPAYWLPYLLVPGAAAASVARLSSPAFTRVSIAWCAMIVIGGVIQVAWPAVAPWPDAPALSQKLYHDSSLILPYATLPSMHVAHVTLGALVAGSVFPSSALRAAGLLLVLVAAAATLTLKEHFFLDAVAGLLLALAAWSWYRR